MVDGNKLLLNVGQFLKAVDRGWFVSKYLNGQKVYSQGDPADAVFYVQSGKLRASVLSAHGKEAIIAQYEKGDFFGEKCLNGHELRTATISAATECVIARIAKETMQRLIHDQPRFSERFISNLLLRNHQFEEDLVDQLFNSSEKRLARVLLLMADFGKDGASDRIIPKISQETLAEMVGTTRSRISFFMNRFRKLGFINYDQDFTIHSSLLNVMLNDKPHMEEARTRAELISPIRLLRPVSTATR